MPIHIFIPIIILFILAPFVRSRLVKPKVTDGIQKPGRFDRFLVHFLTGLTVFIGLITLVGAISGESEMTLVFAIMTVIFLAITLLLKREYNMTYEENEDYFIYNHKNKVYKVYYENIEDWEPGYNEIKIADKTKPEESFVKVNIAVIKPTILLRKIADMTFAGKFEAIGDMNHPDPKREYEIVDFLIQNNYGHLIEDYAEQLNS